MVLTVVVLTGLTVSLLTCVFVLIRNQWVFQRVGEIIHRSHAEAIEDIDLGKPVIRDSYKEYLSYDEMMYPRYWHIWDVEKLKKKAK